MGKGCTPDAMIQCHVTYVAIQNLRMLGSSCNDGTGVVLKMSREQA